MAPSRVATARWEEEALWKEAKGGVSSKVAPYEHRACSFEVFL